MAVAGKLDAISKPPSQIVHERHCVFAVAPAYEPRHDKRRIGANRGPGQGSPAPSGAWRPRRRRIHAWPDGHRASALSPVPGDHVKLIEKRGTRKAIDSVRINRVYERVYILCRGLEIITPSAAPCTNKAEFVTLPAGCTVSVIC